ncbi:hypothetical protein SAMN05421800_1411 [Chryseobacterium balustinum]|uniref:Uncharacterized protein n=1 Tax=Chryseobacterium balustinum TaxID=246 RepID=A0AAX2ILY6_9FLAO|nr:hypothetical protein SAMN05421800_1411 [Chryseobacterium balustinum]SQA90137.1 Uncharacterised protein [Chryseobacterium balustinum]
MKYLKLKYYLLIEYLKKVLFIDDIGKDGQIDHLISE